MAVLVPSLVIYTLQCESPLINMMMSLSKTHVTVTVLWNWKYHYVGPAQNALKPKIVLGAVGNNI